MKKLHVFGVAVLAALMVLLLAVTLSGCGKKETPDSPGGGGGGAPAVQSEGLDFEKIEDTDTYAVVGIGSCKDAKVAIPSTYKNKPVVAVNATAFAKNCENVTEIYVPDSVKTIQSGAFSGCTALQKLTIPVLNGQLGQYFSGDNAGVPSTLKTVILTTMTSVPKYAFKNCTSLEEVEFPASATDLGWACLEGCMGIKKLTTPFVGTTSVYYFDGMYQRALEAKNRVCCNSALIAGGGGYDAHLYNFWGVNFHLSGSYYYFNTSVRNGEAEELIPRESISLTVTNGYITDRSCHRSNVKSVTVSGTSPNEAKGIGRYAFSGCDQLCSVTLSNEIAEIGNHAFYECNSLTSVTLPNGLTELPYAVFWGCSSLASVTLPSSIKGIGERAFYDCSSLASIQIPSGVTSIGEYAFWACENLTSVSLPPSVTELGYASFYGCDKLSYNLYENGKYLGDSTNPYVVLMDVENTSVTSFAIHNNAGHIYHGALYGCSSLKSIVIPASIKSIGRSAFEGCDSLENAVFEKHGVWKVVKEDTNSTSTLSESELSDTRRMATYLRAYKNGSYGGYRDYDWYCT